MNEQMKTYRNGVQLQLLTTVSVLALLASGYEVRAADADHPLLWIELGGQLERNSGQQEPFVPVSDSTLAQLGMEPPSKVQARPTYGLSREAGIVFEPQGNWTFSASIRYGRSQDAKHVHQTTTPAPKTFCFRTHCFIRTPAGNSEEVNASDRESYAILDFKAGKDVGMGFGGISKLSGGVRFAQFSSKSTSDVNATPDSFASTDLKYGVNHNHLNTGTSRITRNFRGVGPSLSWDASLPFAGDPGDFQLNVDWGANGAVLFGRQKAVGNHQSNNVYYRTGPKTAHVRGPIYQLVIPSPHAAAQNRARSVVAPNLGGFAGISVQYPNAKLSLGYRADFFFDAMDGGMDTAKKEAIGFHGPFATISVGLGG